MKTQQGLGFFPAQKEFGAIDQNATIQSTSAATKQPAQRISRISQIIEALIESFKELSLLHSIKTNQDSHTSASAH